MGSGCGIFCQIENIERVIRIWFQDRVSDTMGPAGHGETVHQDLVKTYLVLKRRVSFKAFKTTSN